MHALKIQEIIDVGNGGEKGNLYVVSGEFWFNPYGKQHEYLSKNINNGTST